MTLVSIPAEVAALAPAEVTTKKLNPPWAPRRPQAADDAPAYHPRTIGIVDPPTETGQLPMLAQFFAAAAAREAALDADRRPADFAPRHRAPRRSLAEWYLQLEGWQLLIIGAGIGATVHAVFSNLLWLVAVGGLG